MPSCPQCGKRRFDDAGAHGPSPWPYCPDCKPIPRCKKCDVEAEIEDGEALLRNGLCDECREEWLTEEDDE